MAETEEVVNETQISQQGDTQVVRKNTSISNSAGTQLTVVKGIWLALGILEVLLAFRFVLKLLGANPDSGFVGLVYSVSGLFVAPFQGIFSAPTTQGDITVSVLETSTIVAMVVYALVAWGLTKLASLNRR